MIATLINRRSEGAHWDFKRCHQKKKSDFIHDVLCLANSKPCNFVGRHQH